jgi:DNA-binding transcriptional ArsR family regulator
VIVGPSGIGKSHLLGLVEARIRALPNLAERLVVVALPEDFHPSSIVHLLAKILDGLPVDESLPPVAAQLPALRRLEPVDAIDMAVAMIRARLAGRSLLLMLEDLDVIFDDLGRKAQAKLRKIVQTEQGWSICATARSAIAWSRHTEPFHGTFVVHQVEPLRPAEGREMMVRLARLRGHPQLEASLASDAALELLHAAHHLVGGSPRVLALLFDHLVPERLDDLEAILCGLAEALTPLLRERMSRLSAGQRPVMEFLAERWVPASVSEIADATFIVPTTVSTHLRALRREQQVHALAVGKERLYELADPLQRIGWAIRHDHSRAAALADIARAWAQLDQAKRRPSLDAWLYEQAPASAIVTGVRIPVWIASGRSLPALRQSLQADGWPPYEHALAAEDTARAFARLGAESRGFARAVLRAHAADDLLARLPREPG